jgi:hypothetical protein
LVEIHPPVIACRILALKAVLKPSLMGELLDKKCNRASDARASSKCLTIRNNHIYPSGKSGCDAHDFPSLVTQDDIMDVWIGESSHKRLMTSCRSTAPRRLGICQKASKKDMSYIQAYRNMERHEEGRWYRRFREVCDWVWRNGISAWRRGSSGFPVAVTVGIV